MILQDEFDTLVPRGGVDRRTFVRGALGSGFAPAALPVMAQTVIKTDSQGLVAGEVTIPVGDFKLPAYRAAPAGRANAPVVLVISEIFAVHEHIAEVARRFAKAGVAWYGRLVGQSTALTPRQTVDVAGPVLGLYGGADTGIPLDTVERKKAALAAGSAAARRSESVVCPDAPHAFRADCRPSFRKEAADDGWRRALACFNTPGVA